MKPMKVEAGEHAPDLEELLKEAKAVEGKFGSTNADGFQSVRGVETVKPGYYWTNQMPIEVEDVKNKGATMENSDVTTRASPYYPTAFSTTGALENFTGGEGPVLKSAGGNIQKYQDQQIKKSIEELSRRIN